MKNRLHKETSPYLLQHADNPVDWYPYGEEAFKKAQEEDKLLLISVGYAACHWCHIMEKESFNNVNIADYMNAHFVCVKVDKEERPDVDKIYMNAIQFLQQVPGGWPLNCFCLPDGRPVFGGTYFKPDQWLSMLEQLQRAYQQNPTQFLQQADAIIQQIQQASIIQAPEQADWEMSFWEERINTISRFFDIENGGLKASNKFPMPGLYEMLLNAACLFKNNDWLQQVENTIDHWIYGGIYDQIGGGFSRYTVDTQWLIPHFEKMLYDNAQIMALLAKAYRHSKKASYRRVVEETFAWLQRDMLDEKHLFYSSYDADSEGQEGAFYTWQFSEIKEVIKEPTALFTNYFGITEEGNFQSKNILNVPSMQEPDKRILEMKQQLFALREQRVKPALSKQHIASWNALMLSALCDMYLAFNKKEYYQQALRTAEAILEAFYTEHQTLLHLAHHHKDIAGFLDDYVFLTKSFIDVYVITFDKKWLLKAEALYQTTFELFYDEAKGLCYYTPNSQNTISRPLDVEDKDIPSANAILVENGLRLSCLLSKMEYKEKSELLLKHIPQSIYNMPIYSYSWINSGLLFSKEQEEWVWVGEEANEYRQNFCKDYQALIYMGGSVSPDEDLLITKGRYKAKQTLGYHCKNQTCTII